MRRIILYLIMILAMASLTACWTYRFEEDYKGRILDADTKEPIQGVVVLAEWYKKVFMADASQFRNAKETLTDANGEFFIPGMGKLLLSRLVNMEYADLMVFKAGYSDIGCGPWRWDNGEKLRHDVIKWEGESAIIYLKKLTIEERRRRSVCSMSAPDEKQALLRRELDKERKEAGVRLW